jgi:flagellar basal-body rod modification protein FlgD
MVSDVTFSSALNQQSQTSNSSSQLAEDFAQFLTLLTTQLQNQDPLSPMDSAEFTNQLVLFSGVEQQINSNQKLDALVSLQLSNAFTSSLNYVGLDVSYLGDEMPFDGTTPTKITYALGDQAVFAKINIRNEEGDVVFSTDAHKSVGKHEFTWDGSMDGGGTAPSGTYTVTIDALDINAQPIDSTTVVTGRVRGVETQNGQIFVLVGERAVPLSSILNASQPPVETAEPPAEEEEA